MLMQTRTIGDQSTLMTLLTMSLQDVRVPKLIQVYVNCLGVCRLAQSLHDAWVSTEFPGAWGVWSPDACRVTRAPWVHIGRLGDCMMTGCLRDSGGPA